MHDNVGRMDRAISDLVAWISLNSIVGHTWEDRVNRVFDDFSLYGPQYLRVKFNCDSLSIYLNCSLWKSFNELKYPPGMSTA